jgi:hypothetical protein
MIFGMLLLTLGFAVADEAPAPQLSASLAGAHPTFRVEPVSPEALQNPAVFSIHVAREGDRTEDLPALLGSYVVDKQARSIVFTSRFPAEPGVSYTAVYQDPGGNASRRTFAVPKREASPPTAITRVSPQSDVLPENLLKFYIEFSAPMGRGASYTHIHLLDERGKPLDLPFLELGEELWDPSGTRFTLFFDPGRIKKGLKPREEFGPVLIAGKTYTLVIAAAWLDATGQPLKAGFRKTFRAGPEDATCPDPKSWSVTLPQAGTRSPLLVRFHEPLDRAMLARAIGVEDGHGKGVSGVTAIGDDATSWSFTPDRPWSTGRHALVVDRTLEDLAGNSVARPFEVDMFQKVDRRVTADFARVPFDVAQQASR